MVQPSAASPRSRKRPADRTPRGRFASWFVGLAASALIFVSLGSYLYHRRQLDAIAAGHLRLVVTGPAELHPEAPAEYGVTTTSVTGEPLVCEVEMSLRGPGGKQRWGLMDNHYEEGHLSAKIPADLALSGLSPAEAQLKVVAARGSKREEAELPLAIRPARYTTRLWLDRPRYQPGQTARYRSLTLSQFGLAAEGPLAVRFEIRDPDGRVVPDSQSEAVTDRGVAWGTFLFPEHLKAGLYTLVAQSADGSFPDEKQTLPLARPEPQRFKKELRFAADRYAPGDTVQADFLVQRGDGQAAAGLALRVAAVIDGQTVFQSPAQADDKGHHHIEFPLPKKLQPRKGVLSVTIDDDDSPETVAEPIPLAIEKIDVQFYPEGGELVAGVENRVYFAARSPDGRPAAIRGVVYDSHGTAAPVAVKSTFEGLGCFTLVPQRRESYSLKITEPAGISAQPKLPAAAADARATLNTGSGVFAEGDKLEFSLVAAKADLPLVVTASCRGVAVGQQMLVTKPGRDPGSVNSVVIPLDDSVGGVVRLCVFDFSKSPPELLAQRLVYRRMPRRLSVRAEEPAGGYAAGSRIELPLAVTDEKGEPASAALGVAVVEDATAVPKSAAKAAAKGTVPCSTNENWDSPQIPDPVTSFLLAPYVQRPEEVPWLDSCLAGGKDSDAALDLLLGTQGCRREEQKRTAQTEPPRSGGPAAPRPADCAPSPQPPAVVDNLASLRAKYEQDLAEYRSHRTRTLYGLITLSFLGGLGLALGITILGLLRAVAGARLWAPLLLAAASCAVGGGVVRDASWHESVDATAVAFASFCPPRSDAALPEGGTRRGGEAKAARPSPPAAAEYAWQRPQGSSSAAGEPPALLYWNPLLVTGRDGRGKIGLDLPNGAHGYRILVEAHGEGRLGSAAIPLVPKSR
jgi:hypothetical protein